ncbi:hypothetical protein [Solidesulfovibrio sp. C21]|uniref:hypothetical protein n=1 Tax=Solidesulfovibrio sp. C21 TaxID=3398613 RepID=UPI0039FBB1B8
MAINGNTYDWESVTIQGPQGVFVDVQEISYKDERPIEPTYGKALELSHSFTDFEDKERSATYHFRRPTRPQISRSQSAMRKDAMSESPEGHEPRTRAPRGPSRR